MNPAVTTTADTRPAAGTSPASLRRTARIALAGLVAWPTIVLALRLIQAGEYDPGRQAISELARGRGGALMAVAFVAFGVGTAAFGAALRGATPVRVAPVLLALAGVGDVFSAIFRADVGDTHTVAGQIHVLSGIVTFGLVIGAMFATVRPLSRLPHGGVLGRATAVWAVAAFAAVFLVPILGDDRFGIAERALIATWLSWLVAGAVLMIRSARARAVAAESRR